MAEGGSREADRALLPAGVQAECTPEGGWRLRHRLPLEPHPPTVLHRLRHWARTGPERPALAERAGEDWRALGYGALMEAIDRTAAGLLALSLQPGDRLAILSENELNNAILRLAAMSIGIIVIPVSPAYSLLSEDFAKLRAVIALAEPALVYVEDASRYARALEAIGVERVVATRLGSCPALSFDALADEPDGRLREHQAAIGSDTIAAIFFTSGSTGEPKGAITTQRMITANQQAYAQVWPFLAAAPPVLLDWLPWHHTFGGNDNLHKLLWHGGTLHIDRGRPQAERFEETVDNLKRVAPTLYINVPRAFELLVPRLDADTDLRAAFFRNLRLIFFAGAALPDHVYARLRALARAHAAASGREIALVSGYGATEAGSTICVGDGTGERPDAIGVPLPGYELRLVPIDGKLEIRVKGPNIAPGYWRRPDLDATTFDGDGFWRSGDAARPLDPDDPTRGLLLNGRLADDFKLTTGTRVAAGLLRTRLLAVLGEVVQDLVVAGEGRSALGLLVFATAEGPGARARLAERLAMWNRAHSGASERIARALVLTEPPSLDAGELTDKGQVNRRAVVARRADAVRRLFQQPAPAAVIEL